MKWALLAVTILSILLSWGKNFMGFTDIFIDYMPMYAKFRTVSSILVIAEFTIPLLAMMALKKIVDDPTLLTKKIKFVYISFGLTAGFALLFALLPTTFFDFTSLADKEQLSKYVPADMLGQILSELSKMRVPIFVADCWRSFIIILIGTLLLLLYKAQKLKAEYMVGGIIVLCLADMWMVNKRYLNDDMFVESSVRDLPKEMTATDKLILQDKGLDYRVLNLASDTFNENETSYFHKSIGGYHAAKLRRYQEMIEAYIVPEMQKMMPAIADATGDMTKVAGDSIYPVLNMLNMKYVIVPLQGGQTVPILNPYAYGNAWFVDRISFADNANQEIERIGKIDLRHEAVADKSFKEMLGEAVAEDDSALVTLKSYEPNQLVYDVQSEKGGIVVFSEIYYPGWTATVDNQPVEVGRVNYILRALNVKPGHHEVILTFKPKSLKRTETMAYVSYGILLLFVLLGIFFEYKQKRTSN
jgi:hypothetical protein